MPAGLTDYIPAGELQGYMGTAILTDKSVLLNASSALQAEGQKLFTEFAGNIHNAYAAAMLRAFVVLAVLSALALIFALMMRASKKEASE